MLMMSMITVEYVTNYGDKFWTSICMNVEKFIIISQTNKEKICKVVFKLKIMLRLSKSLFGFKVNIERRKRRK